MEMQDLLQMSSIRIRLKNEDGSDITQDVDVIVWWRDVGQARFPRTSVMTRQFLSIPSVSVTTERVFRNSMNNGSPFQWFWPLVGTPGARTGTTGPLQSLELEPLVLKTDHWNVLITWSPRGWPGMSCEQDPTRSITVIVENVTRWTKLWKRDQVKYIPRTQEGSNTFVVFIETKKNHCGLVGPTLRVMRKWRKVQRLQFDYGRRTVWLWETYRFLS